MLHVRFYRGNRKVPRGSECCPPNLTATQSEISPNVPIDNRVHEAKDRRLERRYLPWNTWMEFLVPQHRLWKAQMRPSRRSAKAKSSRRPAKSCGRQDLG